MSKSATLPNPTTGTNNRWLALAAMVFATGMTFIDMTIVSIGAPVIEADLGITDDQIQWVINGYLLGLAATFALMGRLSDVWGHRRMVLLGTVVFAFSSLMCGITPGGSFGATWLIGWRVIEGVGAAMLFPAALAIVVASFPIRERGKALATFFAVTGALTAIGPVAGGYLVDWNWRSIFWVNLPVAAIAVVLTLLCKIHDQRRQESIDWIGGIMVIVGMGLSVVGFQQAGTWGWLSPATWACVIGGLVVLGVFVRRCMAVDSPLIKMKIFSDRAFQADGAALFFLSMAFVPVFFFLSFYAQAGLQYTAQESGLFLMWFFLGFAVASQAGGVMLDKVGSRIPILVGGLAGAAGYAGWGATAASLNATTVTPWIVLAGAGTGLVLGPASTDAVNRAIDSTYGEVTGITQTLRNYAAALGMAILGSALTSQMTSRVTATAEQYGLNAEQTSTIVRSLGHQTSGGANGAGSNMPEGLSGTFWTALQNDFVSAISIVAYAMAAAMFLAGLMALRHPGGLAPAAMAARAEHAANDKDSDAKPASTSGEIIKRVVVFAAIFAVIYVVVSYLL